MNSLDPRSNHAEAPVTHADRDMAALLDLLPLALVNRSVDMGAHLEMLAERIRVALSADGVLVLLGEPGGEFLRLRAQAWSERARLNLSGRDYGELWPMERGVAGWVMRTGESALVEDMTRDERVRDRPRPPESVIAAPLLVNGRPIGVVRVSALGIARFSVADQRLVEALARATGIAVENARLSQEAREHTEEIEARVQALTTLQEIGTCVLETMDSRAVVELVLERAMEVGPFDLGAMHLAREGNRLDPIVLRGFSDPEHSATFSSDGEAGRREAMFHVLSSREPLVIEDLASYDGLRTFKSEGMLSAVIIPVRAGADAVGILAFGARQRQSMAPRNLQLLSAMGDQLGVAIQKAQFYEDLQQAFADLRRTEEGHARLAAILEATPDLVAIADASGHRMYLNAAGRQILGIGQDDDLSFSSFTDDRPDWSREQFLNEAIPTAIRDGIWSGESVFTSRDGREVPVSQVILAHRGADGSVEFFSTIARDLTLRRRLESQLARAQQLETAGRVAGQVAHDFNNLLAPLVGYPELIKLRLPQNHPVIPFCDEMLSAATRMTEINDDLLTLGRRGHFEHEPIDLNQLVQDALDQAPEGPATLALEVDLAAELPILGSPPQLTRLLANLVANARDSMRDVGTLGIRTQSVYLDQPIGRYTQINVGEYVELDVSDTGSGITPETREKMFDVFYTTKTTDKRRGSGLGLSVVLAVADDHQAYVDFDSTVGQGTTFRIYFPAYRGLGTMEPVIGTDGGTESILVVDDDAGQRDVVSMMLRTLGYEVEVVENGEQAIAAVKDRGFDLMILDMVMPPGIDGAETYRQIVEIRPGQRAIIISGFAESGRVGEAQALGAGPHVRKPVTMETLARAVRQELTRVS